MPRWFLSLLWSVLFFAVGPGLVGLTASAQIGPPSDRQQIQAERFFTRGLTNARLGDYESALRYYERALERASSEASILSAMAEAYHALDDVNTALFYAEQAVEHAPANSHYHTQLASFHVELGNYEEAIAAYERLLERFPEDDQTRNRLAPLYGRVGDYDAAIAVYEQLLERSNNPAPVYQRLLQLYVQTNDRRGAMLALEGLVETAPGAPSPRRMLVEFLLEEDDEMQRDRAVGLLEEVLELEPDDTETILALADLYRELDRHDDADALVGQLSDTEDASASDLVERAGLLYGRSLQDPSAGEQAEQLLKQALVLEPDNYNALVMLGDLYYRRHAYDEAATLLQRAVEENPRDHQVWIQAAAAFLEKGDATTAAEMAEEGLVLFPDRLPLVRIAAYAHLETEHTLAAIEHFEHVVSLTQDEAADDRAQQSHYLAVLGVLHSRNEDTEAAEEAYDRAIDLDPENAMALNNLAYSLAERDRELERALTMAEKAVDMDPENAAFLDTLGWVHFRLGNYEEARQWIGKSIATGEASATVYEHYGDVLEQLGEHEQAREYWQQSLEQDPERESARERLGR